MKHLHDPKFKQTAKRTDETIAAIRRRDEDSQQETRLKEQATKPWPAWREALERISQGSSMDLSLKPETVATDLRRLDEKFVRLNEKIDRTNDKVDWLDTRLTREITELGAMTKAGFDEHTERLNKIDTRLTTIDGRLDGIDGQLQELRKGMNVLLKAAGHKA